MPALSFLYSDYKLINKFKMEKGQTVFIVEIDARVKNKDLKEVVISKIGNKYIELEQHYGKFNKETLLHFNGKSSPRYKMYEKKEDYFEELEFYKKVSEIRNYFGSYGKLSISIENIRKIHGLIF